MALSNIVGLLCVRRVPVEFGFVRYKSVHLLSMFNNKFLLWYIAYVCFSH